MTEPTELATLPAPARRHRSPARRLSIGAIRPAWQLPLLVFTWSQLVLLCWWLGQYPGLLSPDSVRYVIHVTSGPWTADHSVLYDSMILASLKLTHSIAVLTFLQTTAASAVVAYCVSSVHAFGVRARWAVIPGLLMPFVPSFGAFVSTLWKDVPFSFCELLVAATTIRLLAWRRLDPSDPRKSSPRRLLLALGAEFIGLVLFRNDGFIMVLVLAVLLAITFKGIRLKVVAAALAALIALAFAETVVYPAADIKAPRSTLSYGTFYADIALAYAEAPRTFTAADRALMAQVAPLRTWRHASNCYTSDPLFNKTFNYAESDKLKTRLAELWFKTLARTPVLVIRTRLCRASVAWDLFPPPRSKARLGEVVQATPTTLYATGHLIPANIRKNLELDPLVSGLGTITHKLRLAGYSRGWIQVLIFRGALWCYVLYLALFIAVRRRRRWDILAIGAMSLANQLSVIAANPAQLYRYMVGPIFIGMLLVPLCLVRRDPDAAKVADADAIPAPRLPDPDAPDADRLPASAP